MRTLLRIIIILALLFAAVGISGGIGAAIFVADIILLIIFITHPNAK